MGRPCSEASPAGSGGLHRFLSELLTSQDDDGAVRTGAVTPGPMYPLQGWDPLELCRAQVWRGNCGSSLVRLSCMDAVEGPTLLIVLV